jgi:peroxiredoxin
MTGRPGVPLPLGWDAIPGARGCTPQSCAFRDQAQDLAQFSVRIFGMSTQTTTEQSEAAQRLHLPFELLSDQELAFTKALRLPTFEVEGRTLQKRVTLVAVEGRIVKVFYPVFPSNKNAEEVLSWLRSQPKFNR